MFDQVYKNISKLGLHKFDIVFVLHDKLCESLIKGIIKLFYPLHSVIQKFPSINKAQLISKIPAPLGLPRVTPRLLKLELDAFTTLTSTDDEAVIRVLDKGCLAHRNIMTD